MTGPWMLRRDLSPKTLVKGKLICSRSGVVRSRAFLGAALGQDPAEDWPQVVEALAVDAAGGAALEDLDHGPMIAVPGDKDERNLGTPFLGQVEGREAVEGGQRTVRQDEVRLQLPQGKEELLLPPNPAAAEMGAVSGQFPHQPRCFDRIIFDDQDLQLFSQAHFSVAFTPVSSLAANLDHRSEVGQLQSLLSYSPQPLAGPQG